MAEQTQPGQWAPPAAPLPPPPPRRRSLAGPLILILLGGVFLLWNFGYELQIFRWFAQYWPLLIIVWGLWKFYEYSRAQREGRPAPGIGVGGVLLLLLLIMFGSVASALYRWGPRVHDAAGIMIDGEPWLAELFGEKYEFTEQVEHALAAGQKVRVVTERGSIRIVPGTDGTVKVVLRKAVRAENERRAQELSDSIKAEITTSGDTVSIEVNRTRGGTADLEVHVPREGGLDLMTLRGNIDVSGRRGDVKIHTSRGGFTVEDLTGSVNAHLRHGNARAVRISGDVNIEGRGDEVVVTEVGGILNLSGDFFGAIRMEKIAGAVRFRSARTDMEMARLDGSLVLEGGELRGDRVAGPFSIATRSKDIRLENVSGNIRVATTNGEVLLRPGQLPLGSIEVQNKHGRVELALPSQAAFKLDARTRHGSIDSDFGEVNVDEERSESRASGTVGSGDASIIIQNEHGNVKLRKTG